MVLWKYLLQGWDDRNQCWSTQGKGKELNCSTSTSKDSFWSSVSLHILFHTSIVDLIQSGRLCPSFLSRLNLMIKNTTEILLSGLKKNLFSQAVYCLFKSLSQGKENQLVCIFLFTCTHLFSLSCTHTSQFFLCISNHIKHFLKITLFHQLFESYVIKIFFILSYWYFQEVKTLHKNYLPDSARELREKNLQVKIFWWRAAPEGVAGSGSENAGDLERLPSEQRSWGAFAAWWAHRPHLGMFRQTNGGG